MYWFRTLVGVVVVSFLLGPSLALAQGTADIVGRVTDTSGGVLPGVNVTAENVATKNVRTTVTSESGDYSFNLLPIGSYMVRIELQGFQTVTTKVELNTGDRARVDGRMQVGSISESVMVTGESPLLQTDTATLSTLVTEKSVQDLPVQGRNIMRLVQLVPGGNEGVLSSLADGTRPDDRRQTSSVSINGVGDVLNNQMVDGMDNNERAIGSVGIKPSIDATAEVRVQTNTYSAETGRTLGGIINIITKSGSNEFNGSAFEFFRNDAFDSKNYFAVTKPELNQNQFGASIGGPIRSNRTFFFGDYEAMRSDQEITNVITVPTAKMRTGDFSEISRQIFDPTTTPRTPFAGNIIPANRWDPVAAQLINLYPLPNGPGIANNYTANNLREQDHQTMDARVDHRFNDNNTVFARYSFNLVDTITPDFCPQVTDKGQTFNPTCVTDSSEQGQFPGPNHTTAQSAMASWVRVINPTLISEVKGAYIRPHIYSRSFNEGLALGDLYGIPNANVPGELALHTSGMPAMLPTGYARMGDPQWLPLLTRDSTFHFAGAVTKTAGAHNIKMGGGVILREFTVLQSNSPKGLYNFNANPTASGANTGDGMASFLLGYPSSYQRRLTPQEPFTHTNEPSLYVQDDWRARSWLTVNLGLRYDVYTPFTEEQDRLANFSPEEGRILVAGVDGVSRSAGVETDYSNIQPRVGFSASLPNRIVLRGGYGMSFFPNNKDSQSYLKNPPFDFTFGPQTSGADAGQAPTVFLKDGLPAVAPISPSNPRGAVIGTALNYKSDRAQQFNVMVEKEFSSNVITIGYVGHRGSDLRTNPNFNLAPVSSVGGSPDPRRPYFSVYPNMSNANTLRNQGESKYNAMQLIFQRRFTAGLSFNTHYTFAHATELTLAPWDTVTPEWADATLDTRHRYVLQANYALPWGNDLTGISRGVLHGWQVNATAFWQTGTPFSVTNNGQRMNTGAGGNTDRPNVIADPNLPESERTLARWFNTAAFAAQPVGTPGMNGSELHGPNLLHGPSQRRLDMSIFKDLPIGANRLQIRMEIYNITNTANFVNPASSFGATGFGSIASTGKSIPRQMQFGFKYLF